MCSVYDPTSAPTTLRRPTRREPCPICDHADWCELRSDGATHCMRIESAVPGTRGGGWWHNFPDRSARAPLPSAPIRPFLAPPAVPALLATVADRDVVYRALLAASPLS